MIDPRGKDYIVHVTDDLEVVDERELIRCRDCIYYLDGDACRNNKGLFDIREDDYCSLAERKEE